MMTTMDSVMKRKSLIHPTPRSNSVANVAPGSLSLSNISTGESPDGSIVGIFEGTDLTEDNPAILNTYEHFTTGNEDELPEEEPLI